MVWGWGGGRRVAFHRAVRTTTPVLCDARPLAAVFKKTEKRIKKKIAVMASPSFLDSGVAVGKWEAGVGNAAGWCVCEAVAAGGAAVVASGVSLLVGAEAAVEGESSYSLTMVM